MTPLKTQGHRNLNLSSINHFTSMCMSPLIYDLCVMHLVLYLSLIQGSLRSGVCGSVFGEGHTCWQQHRQFWIRHRRLLMCHWQSGAWRTLRASSRYEIFHLSLTMWVDKKKRKTRRRMTKARALRKLEESPIPTTNKTWPGICLLQPPHLGSGNLKSTIQ